MIRKHLTIERYTIERYAIERTAKLRCRGATIEGNFRERSHSKPTRNLQRSCIVRLAVRHSVRCTSKTGIAALNQQFTFSVDHRT